MWYFTDVDISFSVEHLMVSFGTDAILSDAVQFQRSLASGTPGDDTVTFAIIDALSCCDLSRTRTQLVAEFKATVHNFKVNQINQLKQHSLFDPNV